MAVIGDSLYQVHAKAIIVFHEFNTEEETMKVWTKPAVREQEVGLEVTSYLPAEIDII